MTPPSKLSLGTISKMSEEGRKKLGVAWVENDPSHPVAVRPRRKVRRDRAIPRMVFRRLVQEIVDTCKCDLRLQPDAVKTLQEAAENMLTYGFVRCARLADICKLDTVREEHWRFVQESASGDQLTAPG
jgi:histone H3/H4